MFHPYKTARWGRRYPLRTMPELLLEVGCEELPASFVRRAYTDLLENLTVLFTEAGVLDGSGTAIGTPRRLILSFMDLKEREEDQVKEVRGPGVKAAYDADGKLTNAAIGFCRGQGVDPADLRKDDQYVWATKTVIGRPTSEILAEALPTAIRTLNFEKSMRWGSSRMRFARPIRWLLAAFDGKVVSFEIEGVSSGLKSFGHRFYSPEPFEVTSLVALVDGLRERSVEPDPTIRQAQIVEQAAKIAKGTPDLTDALVDENVFLTEWPTAIQGQFKKEYLELPEAVLVTAMAKHERMFPVRNEVGNLTQNFVFIRNSGEDATVTAGAEWVLNARFNDAQFFYEDDIKHNLDYFLEKTERIVFQEKLGSIRARADRLASLSEHLAVETGAIGREIEFARTAGLYAKADLSSGLVSEMSSLQGIIGGAYARREGIFGSVAWAIETQYDIAKNTDPADCSGERASLRLAMADQLDKLAGYLGLGLEPTGSSDPFGLRRAATILIDAAWMWPEALPAYDKFLSRALTLYRSQGIELNEEAAHKSLWSVFASRYASMLPGVRHDILEAAMIAPESAMVTQPRAVKLRTECLGALVDDVSFVQTATRPINIVAAARKKGIEFGEVEPLSRLDHSALESAEGLELAAALSEQQADLQEAGNKENASEIVRLVKALAVPINKFFESTMVMAEQPEVRYARLTLMHATSLQLLSAGDLSKVVIEG